VCIPFFSAIHQGADATESRHDLYGYSSLVYISHCEIKTSSTKLKYMYITYCIVATSTDDVYRTFCTVWTHGFRGMRVDKQTDKQTYMHTYIKTRYFALLPEAK